VTFNSELGGEFAASKYVCVCERRLVLGALRDGLCLLLHLWMWTPHATASKYLLARKGVVEYACIVWSEPLVLASCKIWL
jgi:hypothetical protein